MMTMMISRALPCAVFAVALCASLILVAPAADGEFRAVGFTEPVVSEYLEASSPVPRQLRKVAVEVRFDLTPTFLRFSLPCYPAMVTENDIHFSNGWTETYDPKASSSCEILWDRDSRYARMWIESQNPARIVVRVRAAICDPDGRIAHTEVPSGSPYGKGDWTDEWYYIYPDGMHTRHVRIYTGLASQSLTVTDQAYREIPPNVVHEFQEDFLFGLAGHVPEDDIEESPLTLILMDGRSKRISYKPYPKNYGEFIKANIKVINTKSEYRPYSIAMPYGVEQEPYLPEDEIPHIIQTWPKNPSTRGYSSSVAHTLNWWHYRRTDNTLDQVYIHGMTNDADPAENLVPLAWSWVAAPGLEMEGYEPSYGVTSYDHAQRAYIVPSEDLGPREFKFRIARDQGPSDVPIPMWIVNPAFVIKNWGDSDVDLKVNGKIKERGGDYRVGYEESPSGTDLIIWLKMKSSTAVTFSLSPK
jgi:hypothetical protein